MTIELVHAFHEKFDLPTGEDDVLSRPPDDAGEPAKIDAMHARAFRLGFLKEELKEYQNSIELGDRVGAFDALLDLAYVTFGTALMMGITPEQWNAGMAAVQAANMSKVRAQSADESKRGSKLDVVKPEGWCGPEEQLKRILGELPHETDVDA